MNDTNGTHRKGGRIVAAAPYITFRANRNCDSSLARLGLFCVRKRAFLAAWIYNGFTINMLAKIYLQSYPDFL